jgi:hypothetical protein
MNKPVLPVSSLSLKLPTANGALETYRLAASRIFPARLEGTLNRVAFSAAHVVADPFADTDPWLTAAIDWDKTIAFREHVWDLGLGVAESMDTAQRGMGLDWPTSLELIQRSVKAAKARGNALVFSGAGTDHLAVEDAKSIDDVIRAYEEQIAAIEKVGGRIILMASRALAKLGRNADDYAKVYNRVLSQVREPVIIHWLGDMFDPALANYWGTASLDEAMNIAVGIINANAAKVDGVKVSLLDKQREIDMRRRLDRGVKMYTGDDFNYAELIAGDDQGFSHRCSAFSTPSRRRRPTRCHSFRPATRPASTTCSGRRCRCRATSSRRRQGSTRPALCSWPISTAIRIISPWWAGRRARVRPCIWPNYSGWPTRLGCSPIRNWRYGG